MKRLLTLCLLLGLAAQVHAAPPSRSFTYVAGTTIEADEVTQNEDNIYTYLQAGVDTYSAGTVDSTAITDGTIAAADINTGAVTTTQILNDTILLEDMADSSVGSTEIVNDTIVNADINSAAAISASKLADNEIDQEELAATITFADGDFLDMSSVDPSSTSEGLIIPQGTSCASATATGQLCADTDDDILYHTGAVIPELGTNSITLSGTGGNGSANTALRSNAVIDAFDASNPESIDVADAASTGSADFAARRDHQHALSTLVTSGSNSTITDGNLSACSTFDDIHANITVTATAAPVIVHATVRPRSDAGTQDLTLRIDRDDGTNLTDRYVENVSTTNPSIQSYDFIWIDTPGAGSTTYNLKGCTSATTMIIDAMEVNVFAFP